MRDLGTITITKNKDCDDKTYYSAYIKGVDAVVGGGDTRNEAKQALLENLAIYIKFLEKEETRNGKNIDEIIRERNEWERACKLACMAIDGMPFCTSTDIVDCENDCINCAINYYKSKAEKELKNDKS